MTGRTPPPSLAWINDRALRLSWSAADDLAARDAVHAARRAIADANLMFVRDAVPAHASLLLVLSGPPDDAAALQQGVQDCIGRAEGVPATPPRTVRIPVCYDVEHAPDLGAVAALTGLPVGEIIARHSAAEFTVRFIGFSPGFPYLDGLPAALHVPRLESPRVRVPAGSIAIAGAQAGIYPRATPGGWRLIGRTPLRLLDPGREEPSLLRAGDRVRFTPISPREFGAAEGPR